MSEIKIVYGPRWDLFTRDKQVTAENKAALAAESRGSCGHYDWSPSASLLISGWAH